MLTIDEIKELLTPLNFPVDYLFFDKPQVTPYIVIRMDDSDNAVSDNHFHRQIDTFSLELYYRDPKDRFRFEKFLSEQDFLWQRVTTDAPIGSDGVYVSYYEI